MFHNCKGPTIDFYNPNNELGESNYIYNEKEKTNKKDIPKENKST